MAARSGRGQRCGGGGDGGRRGMHYHRIPYSINDLTPEVKFVSQRRSVSVTQIGG